MTDFQINDAVHVTRDNNSKQTLEGIVAYFGKVDFSDGDDWVGIRLTGSSIGQGKNDGTIQDKQYFICPENCGMFVRISNVTKRTLSRLEELRLRRELNAATVPSTPTTTSTAPITPNVSRIPSSATKSLLKSPAPSALQTPAKTPASSTTTIIESDTSPSVAVSTKNKLEELRQRRAMLKEKRQDVVESTTVEDTIPVSNDGNDTTTPLPETSAATTTKITEITQLHQNKINLLNDKVRDIEQENLDLKNKLIESKKDMENTKIKLKQIEIELIDTKFAQNETLKSTISPSKLAATYALPEEIQEQIIALENKNLDLEDKLEETIHELNNIQIELDQEKKLKIIASDEASKAKIEASSYHNQLQAITDQSTARGQSDASHYKERAKLLAEISNYKRKIEYLEKEKIDLEVTIEDVTLDKEQLQEEKESLEDRYEELKLDAETAQMEVEELKMELEDSRASAERLIQQQASGTILTSKSVTSNMTTGAATTIDENSELESHIEQQQESAEMAQALQVQNVRLREALIRLREQSAIEKMEVTRQLRVVEKQAMSTTDLQAEVDRMTEVIAKMEEEVSDLKDMVEQGEAFEHMVEDLSDRVLSLEEDNVMLQSVVREMEEAAELTAEMEEVQADEIKALTLDMEGRNAIIRNLEEAIKIQRRREDDFRRTVGNYKTTVETLKQEKTALLELQQGGEGEKSDLIASSQKALARAAQLVADAAAIRKREAQAAIDHIDRQAFIHLSNRLEQLLPHHSDIAPEIGAIKGEILCTKVVGKASKSLEGIEASFSRTIRPPLPQDEESKEESKDDDLNIKLSDEVQQQVSTMIHQAEFAHVLVDVSADMLRLLAAGQWPDLLTTESSIELGNILGHTLPDLDSMMQTVLKSLKEEGSLTIEQSNIGALTLTVQNTMQGLRSNIEREDQTIVSPSWNPPGWELMKNASIVKFSCQGAAAALSLVVNQSNLTNMSARLYALYNRVEQGASQAANACLRLSSLDLKNEKLVSSLDEILEELKVAAVNLLKSTKALLSSTGGISTSSKDAEVTLGFIAKLLSSLRGSNMNAFDQGRYHQLSVEAGNAWDGVTGLAHKIRIIDGDGEDVNHLIRAHKIEIQLRDAVDNEPKLAIAHQKVMSLEKILLSRSKEIAMQNARLSELEKLVAKSSSGVFGRGKTADLKSSEEYNALKEENRVLTEAMDVMQREVEMYENEIRALKDQKTPKRGGPAASRGTPRRALTSVTDLSPHPSRGPVGDEVQGNTGVLEATLFRPALQQALREASKWKAAAMTASILDLPPLPRMMQYPSSEDSKESDEFSLNSDDYIRLTSAINNCRMVKASVTIVDLTNREKSPRLQLQEMLKKSNAATELLEINMLRCQANISS